MAFLAVLFYNKNMNSEVVLKWLYAHKKLITTIILIGFVVFFFSLARVSSHLTIPYYVWVSCFSYIALLSYWALSIKDRIIERDVRRYCLTMALLMIFFVIVRSIKWTFGDIPPVAQLSWYMYYVPHILLPLFLFLIALSLDKKLYARYQRLIWWLFFLSGSLIVFILTNSFHQQIFKIVEWTAYYDVIEYQPLFLAIVMWLGFFIGLTVILLIIKSKLPHTNRRIVLPLFVILAYAVYLVLYSFNPGTSGVGFVEFMVTECLIYIALIESLIYVGLIPSNSNYQKLFENSPIPMLIIDGDERVLCKSKAAPKVDLASYHNLCDGVARNVDDWRFCLKKISGGCVLWFDDMSDINAKIKEIENINQALLQETDLLRDEILLGKKEIVLREKDRIYNAIEREISAKRAQVNKMIEKLPDDRAARSAVLMHVCLIGAYIKRMSNMVLLEEMYGDINAIELQNAVIESLFSYRLKNRATHSEQYIDFMLSAELVKIIYRRFEEELEYYFEQSAVVEVFWLKQRGAFELSWQFKVANLTPYDDGRRFAEQLKRYGVIVKCQAMADGAISNLYFAKV